ncbi:MAG TPA: serine hydrolase domain-containing protein [Burkholderiales bacterium]|nr:serine hydrolase domain-containing protein [Burkholderiales bacterium]
MKRHDFGAVHAAMRRYVDAEILPGVSSAVLLGRDVVDLNCTGWADREAKTALREDHIFRAFSNTKVVTSCAVLMLYEEGRIGLDDPVERYLPQLGARRVLRPGATRIDDTEPANGSITIRHLLSHSAGLSYGLLDPGTLIYEAYTGRRVLNPGATLSELIDTLEPLPLVFHPGSGWEYSIATDVLARVVEVVSAERFDVFIRSRILDALGMTDTSFVVPEDKRARFTAYYAGADVLEPMKPGLTRTDDAPYPQAYLRPFPKLSGGGGLVSTLPDMIALVRSLLPGGPTLLKPATIALMMTNQLPENVWIRFPRFGEVVGKGHGLAGAVTLTPSTAEPAGAAGELHWGGLAGTHWWISPRRNLAGVLMTQRQFAFWHPFSFEFKQLVYRAVGG